MTLVVAATARELAAAGTGETLVCGIGPVEAALACARRFATEPPSAVLHVGIAGCRRGCRLAVPSLVLGGESIYSDAAGELVRARVNPDPRLLALARDAFPDAPVLPIGTSARVGGTSGCEVEAMEGFAVLSAASSAGVPALEARVLSNEIEEPDRALWRFDDALALLDDVLPALLAALETC